MSTSSIADAQRLLPLEIHVERWALSVLRDTPFTDCLKIIGLAPTFEEDQARLQTFLEDVYTAR
jgi:hypothetical protein